MHFKRKPIDPNRDILRQLDETKAEMAHFRNQFDEATDPTLTDYYIYRLKAAEAKHQYFTNMLRNGNQS